LKLALGDLVDNRTERYAFSWAGKFAAVRRLQQHTRCSLIPDAARSLDFDQSANIFIEGENLEVLKRLYKSYFGCVKTIYIDPPYNTGGDLIYKDDYAVSSEAYLTSTGQQDTEGNYLVSNPETSGRYHSDWLSMMYPHLFLAGQLLRDDGVIFVSIDDHEVHNLRMLMNEIFGEENRIECFVWKKSYGGGAKEKYAVTQHEYILLYARNLQNIAELWLPPDPKAEARYYKYKDEKYETRGPYRIEPLEATRSMGRRENLVYGIPHEDGTGDVWPKRQWWWKKERALTALVNNELVFTGSGDSRSVSYKQYLRDAGGNERGAKPFSVIDGIYTQNGTADLKEFFGDPPVIQFPKPVALMKLILSMGTQVHEEDLVLDFFAGSCSLAQAVLELNREDGGNRRFICAQLEDPLASSRTLDDGTVLKTISDIGSERIRRTIRKLLQADEGKLDLSVGTPHEDLGLRFFKMVPSHFRAWEPLADNSDAAAYLTQLELFTDRLIDGWKPDGIT